MLSSFFELFRQRVKRMGRFKQQKLHEVTNVSGGEDKISNLPDCILHHILSFLPTKDAVATCILSTRWKFLWTCVPNIDLDDALLYSSRVNDWFPLEVTCFMNFVERVLLLHDVSNIKKFRLSCRVCFSASHVHAWVSSAIKHNVQELDLCLFVEKPFLLPLCVFYSESLTVVKIEMNCLLELPASISFTCLKILHLYLVTFPSDCSTQKLFSSCPVLEELVISDCDWMNLNTIKLSIPTLKSLTIDDLPCFGLSDNLHGCEINIEAANLMFLKYIGYLSNEIFLPNLPSLVNASIEIPPIRDWLEEIGYRIVTVFRGLCNVSSARISNGTIESLFLADKMLNLLPVFGNLTHLELSMEFEFQTIKALMKFLHFTPNLQSLCFTEGLDAYMNTGEDDWILLSVPKCLLYLKRIYLRKFWANHTEISFVNFLLKNACALERMSIYFSRKLAGDTKNQEDVKNQLQMLSKSSRQCKITFF